MYENVPEVYSIKSTLGSVLGRLILSSSFTSQMDHNAIYDEKSFGNVNWKWISRMGKPK